MKRYSKIVGSSTNWYDLNGALYNIAEKYTSSTPVSGDWDTETEAELEEIVQTFNISPESAKALMIYELGFTEDMFDF